MRHRLAFVVPVYVLLISLAYILAYLVRFEFQPSNERWEEMWVTLPWVLCIALGSAALWRELNRSFRFSSLYDLLTLGCSTLTTVVVVWLFNSVWLPDQLIPRSVICINAVFSILLLGGARFSYRFSFEIVRPRLQRHRREPTLIYGVSQDSIGIARMLMGATQQEQPYRAIGFVTEERTGQTLIGGLKIHSLSPNHRWPEIKQSTGAQNLLIPGGTPGRVVRQLLIDCTEAGINVFVIPSVGDLVDGRFRLSVRDVTVSDLLRREPNQLDMEAIKEYVTGKRVMVTGGAGSIGSELCRQLADLRPEQLIIYDQSEFGTFSIEREFAERDLGNVDVRYVVADVLDENMLSQVMSDCHPHLIFHAAAYKHVPLMEDNPQAAVFNNILGTKAVADAANRFGVERFVLISTDKAVRPTSVMGASKLMAEKYVQALAHASKTKFITVRFGNVLDSLGSVVPTFRRQIENGGPVTVTHPDMVRFFMTIPEAVQLVLQAGAIGPSGGVLILDMGEPVRIMDLAKDMILLSGLSYPDDIDIKITGMRPGEKLYEELFYANESGAKRIHEKIFCGDLDSFPPLPQVLHDIRTLEESALTDRETSLAAFRDVVNKYSDSYWEPARLAKAA